MAKIYLLNKPFQVLSQFTTSDDKKTLASFIKENSVYPAGRLDYDSEGLLILTGDGALQARIADPKFKLPKTYWVQVEGVIEEEAINKLALGVTLKDGKTLPAKAKSIGEPQVWERKPPIRQRSNIPTSWLELTIKEGKNRQVRRMTAAVGHPTLRLIRKSIGPWELDNLAPGEYRMETVNLPAQPKNTVRARKTVKSKKMKRGRSRS